MSGNPLIRLIQSALDLLQKGFDYESMFRYLRTGLVTEETEDVDRLEIYVRAMGIRGICGSGTRHGRRPLRAEKI